LYKDRAGRRTSTLSENVTAYLSINLARISAASGGCRFGGDEPSSCLPVRHIANVGSGVRGWSAISDIRQREPGALWCSGFTLNDEEESGDQKNLSGHLFAEHGCCPVALASPWHRCRVASARCDFPLWMGSGSELPAFPHHGWTPRCSQRSGSLFDPDRNLHPCILNRWTYDDDRRFVTSHHLERKGNAPW